MNTSYRASNGLLLRILGVTILPFRTQDTLTGISQARKFTVGPIGTRNGVGVLQLNSQHAFHINKIEKKIFHGCVYPSL